MGKGAYTGVSQGSCEELEMIGQGKLECIRQEGRVWIGGGGSWWRHTS
jgi:hypothetical protein